MSELDELLEDARALEPRHGEADDASLARRAVLAGRARARARAWRARIALLGAGVAIAAIALLAWTPEKARRETVAHEIVELTLPTGDRLATTGDARFEVRSAERARRIHLAQGAAMFDVAPLGPGSSFEVSTPHAIVAVRGTVFVVEVGARATSVRVYEGHVEVRARGERLALHAGDHVHRDAATQRSARLERRAREAADRRARVARIAAPEPDADQAHASDPPAASPRPRATRRAHPTTTRAEPAIDPTERRDAARAHLLQGDPAAALAALPPPPERDGEWTLLEADALRALGRDAEAAHTYERAARTLPPGLARSAGFLAAELYLRRLHDPARALAALDASRVDAEGTALRERALVLRAEAQLASDRRTELTETARRYLDAYPNGPRAAWMQLHAQ
ncbi:FecR family protein [Sandaracinus amylolyticus]|uniref:FecR protein domain-containing protein n=1 Tax=Sandaracinus amylolyticus TaxID=927083 RepID=A0A0F6SHJ4_9BACT|nr:FecR family protein [Sandaracinus amylolyticus]AKF10549.1 transcriptional regulator, putative protein [Sandaracinus amylolyticus]